jgi:predicted hotdog family 3-hydroxylacyl-ACP dehydratase
MRLDRAWIESRLPHRGRMCLLDEVLTWNAEAITCRSGSHRSADHPLRAHGRLGIACGIEYAAQAMAVHGALVAGMVGAAGGVVAAGAGVAAGPPRAGYLTSVRNVRFHALRLDDIPEDLVCNATRIAGDRQTVLYEFALHGGNRPLLAGRAGIVLEIAALAPHG